MKTSLFAIRCVVLVTSFGMMAGVSAHAAGWLWPRSAAVKVAPSADAPRADPRHPPVEQKADHAVKSDAGAGAQAPREGAAEASPLSAAENTAEPAVSNSTSCAYLVYF